MKSIKIFNNKKGVIKFIKDKKIPLNNFYVRYVKNYCKECKNKKIMLVWYS